MELNRRGFMGAGAAFFASAGLGAFGADSKIVMPKDETGKVIQGFNETNAGKLSDLEWKPFSERKVRVGIAGEGFCDFGSAFGYQNHPNVEVVACADVQPDRLKLLQERVKAPKAYPSCEEMIRHAAEDKLEAVYIATDAPSHARLAILALDHGLNVATAVPAILGKDQLDLVPKLIDAVKRSGKLYMMNETSAFRPECYAMRKLYEAGHFGRVVYTEGEYVHFTGRLNRSAGKKRDYFSYKGWRWGLPPQYYPTHSNGYYTCVTHKRFTEVVCTGLPSTNWDYQPGKNGYDNVFQTEVAYYKCEDGSSARMGVFWDTDMNGYNHGEDGRMFGQKGSYFPTRGGYRGFTEAKVKKDNSFLLKPQLPPGMPAGGHGGSHGYLTDDFLRGILVKDHKVCVDLKTALDTTVAGIYAHLSAVKGGETLKIPAVM